MPSRMDRYNIEKTINKRTEKNKELYEDIREYTSLKEVKIEPIIEIKDTKRRVSNTLNEEKIDEQKIEEVKKPKDYDINKVLENAKSTRVEKDELESKRKLTKDEYNITSSIDLKDIKKKKNAKDVLSEEEKEEIKEMIDTIYSKKLREEIDKTINIETTLNDNDLMSELLPEDSDETIIDDELTKKIIEEEKQTLTSEINNIDKSFYTKSMELSKMDFEDEEDNSFLELEKDNKLIKIIILLIIMIILGLILFFIYKSL